MHVALVTGGASGIGAATVDRLAADGFQVVSADRAAGPEREGVEAVQADLERADGCAAAVAAAAARGPLRAVVNVAGVMASGDSAATIEDDELERLLAVNVGAIFRLARHAVPHLRAAGGGAIVNTASVHAYASMASAAAYAASKGAIVALTRQMAIDLADDGIRVVAVAPGSVDTPLTRSELARRGVSAEDAGFGAGGSQLGRVLDAAEIAAVISFLVSGDASALNGTTVVADAGLLTRLV